MNPPTAATRPGPQPPRRGPAHAESSVLLTTLGRFLAVVITSVALVLAIPQASAIAEVEDSPTLTEAQPAAPSSQSVGTNTQPRLGTIRNGDRAGATMRFDQNGHAIDAHDGEIRKFGDRYYLYGTSYGCGYQLLAQPTTPFCGFRAYSSPDLEHWRAEGDLFPASNPTWQRRCDSSTWSCYRPHVIYNRWTRQYVLWINTYDVPHGYRVFTSARPNGGFREIAPARVTDTYNGDMSLFVDTDGRGYIAYTSIGRDYSLVVEALNGSYTSGTGRISRAPARKMEAPAMFTKDGRYYITYSDPNCAYCSGTGTGYVVSASPLGQWHQAGKISTDSCGGQPAAVSRISVGKQVVYLYQSDRWVRGALNQSLATHYWEPLRFSPKGALLPLRCLPETVLPIQAQRAPEPGNITSGRQGFRVACELRAGIARGQTFVSPSRGTLARVSATAFRTRTSSGPFVLSVFRTGSSGLPTGAAVFRTAINPAHLRWTADEIVVAPRLAVAEGETLALTLEQVGPGTAGCAGTAYSRANPYPQGSALLRRPDLGWGRDSGIDLKFWARVDPR